MTEQTAQRDLRTERITVICTNPACDDFKRERKVTWPYLGNGIYMLPALYCYCSFPLLNVPVGHKVSVEGNNWIIERIDSQKGTCANYTKGDCFTHKSTTPCDRCKDVIGYQGANT